MRKGKYIGFLLIFICFTLSFTHAQEVSEKQDISIFNLSYYAWDIPDDVLGSIDSEIRSVFINLGRFNVLEVRKRFDADSDLQSFINSIREFKEQNVEIPEEVSYGRVIFTEADFQQLISSFIVILPEVTYFNVIRKEKDNGELKEYEVEIKTSYSILDASTMQVIAKPSVSSNGSDKNRKSAIQDAIEGIPLNLAFEIKSVSIFTLKTGVLEVYSGGVTIEKGKNMGILPGFEFEIVKKEELKSGLERERHAGLILVRSVSEEVSEATVLYGRPEENDQLLEVPRVGGDIMVYGHVLWDVLSKSTEEDLPLSFVLGFKATWSLGLYAVKPLVFFEIPFAKLSKNEVVELITLLYGFPGNVFIGAEFNLYMGRLQISPTIAGGLGFYYPWEEGDEDDKFLSHLGFKAMLGINYLFSRDAKFTLEAGYQHMFPIYPSFFNDYGGVLLGCGVVFKL
ncbi:MAG: hypothetical protein JW881_19725 [Spirochaetales bacterium]|nr:hypothetical protein [Spirochaetales bacterium]